MQYAHCTNEQVITWAVGTPTSKETCIVQSSGPAPEATQPQP